MPLFGGVFRPLFDRDFVEEDSALESRRFLSGIKSMSRISAAAGLARQQCFLLLPAQRKPIEMLQSLAVQL